MSPEEQLIEWEKDIHIRPLVKKWYPHFVEYVKKWGHEKVKQCLQDGKAGGVKLVASLSRKDRYQLMQLLDMV